MSPTPQTTITLIRHGQALHNVDHDYTLPDPVLTSLGESQCRTLPERLSTHPSTLPAPTIIFTSPLKRTIQTSLLGLQPWLQPDDNLTPPRLIALPELQETSKMPCDTGSDVEELEGIWGEMVEWGALKGEMGEGLGERETWRKKEGVWAPEPEKLKRRAKWVRAFLKKVAEEEGVEHIVCVLHGGFLHYLTEDWSGQLKTAGTGWANTEFRSFTLADDPEDPENVKLMETKGSRDARVDTPLGPTEKKQFEETVVAN
ncbi:phosphoglycerate mutase-like protein [Ascodesmis nigricans]|uniref:Phosphoglycerate mutase-like protein n=1 Tax=Ascodesmis nigricans TaxID=341454 RepID=A0A4S2MQN1_9PEZI|nr:phosphoglycerate mutase-like protein [Ascodesmis nigricans]